MSATEYGRIIADIAKGFPAGTKVFHRSNGKRGFVIGWDVRFSGNTYVIIDWGTGVGAEYAMCLSLDPVPEGGDGELWKESA